MKSFFKTVFILPVLVAVVLSSCIKDPEEPPVSQIPLGDVLTIDSLRKMYQGEAIKFTEYKSVYAVVTADDNSGNLYKNIYIKDNTGAICLHTMSSGGLYAGDSIRINLKNLVLTEYRGLLQLDSVQVDSNIVKQATLRPVEPILTTLPELIANPEAYESHLIKLENVQFLFQDAGQVWADKPNQVTLERTIEDCAGNTTIVRTSGYADFASQLTPTGNGSIVAVMGIYNTTIQLYIRKPAEVVMNNERCEDQDDGLELLTIAQVRELYQGAATNLPANTKIIGTFISDVTNGNLTNKNAYIMDESGEGIALRFLSAHNFTLGQKVKINISTIELSEFNNLLQITNIPNGNARVLGNGTLPEPAVVTLAELNANLDTYESRLIKINNASISSTAYTSGSISISDGTGNAVMYISNYATFLNASIPQGTVSITGIASCYGTTTQVLIRNTSDVVETGPGGGTNHDELTLMSVQQVRNLHTGSTVNIPASRKIVGTVFSDAANGNTLNKNIFIFDTDNTNDGAGIVVRFVGSHSYPIGTKLSIDISNCELSRFNGLLQLNNVPNGNVLSLGTGTLPQPINATIDEVTANINYFEARLVTFNNVTISGAATWNGVSGNTTVTDGQNTITHYTTSYATFKDEALPTGNINITGIVSVFNTPQLNIRSLNDVTTAKKRK